MQIYHYQMAIKAQMEANGVRQTPLLMALGVCEEAGEVAHAMLKREQGVRGYDDDEYFHAQLRDAIGDTGVYLMELCEQMGWDFEAVLKETAQHVLDRNEQGYPEQDSGKGE